MPHTIKKKTIREWTHPLSTGRQFTLTDDGTVFSARIHDLTGPNCYDQSLDRSFSHADLFVIKDIFLEAINDTAKPTK